MSDISLEAYGFLYLCDIVHLEKCWNWDFFPISGFSDQTICFQINVTISDLPKLPLQVEIKQKPGPQVKCFSAKQNNCSCKSDLRVKMKEGKKKKDQMVFKAEMIT